MTFALESAHSPEVSIGQLLEVEVEENGEVAWKSAEVRELLSDSRFICYVDFDEDFVEEYSLEMEGTEWRRGSGGITRVVSERGLQREYLIQRLGQLPYCDLRWMAGAMVEQAAPEHVAAFKRRAALPPAAVRFEWLAPTDEAAVAASLPDLETALHPVSLRDYQREGVEWLLKSRLAQRSVILGDEMGLGKTIQTVSLLQTLLGSLGCPGPCLVVVPLSTLAHWQNELARAPSVLLVTFHGPAAARRAILQYEWAHEQRGAGGRVMYKWNVILTTYEVLSAEHGKLSAIEWQQIVFDEAQRLKNSKSATFANAAALRAPHMLLLSGTPLQNNSGEIYSLLHLIDPKRFRDEATFLDRFGRLNEPRQVAALTSILRPLLLRRTKADVEERLAPLIEQYVYVEITPFQKCVYKALHEQNRELLLGGAMHASAAPQFHNLHMLLRQCCNHPYLVKGVEERAAGEVGGFTCDEEELWHLVHASGKTIFLSKLLPYLCERGHRVLIFSQFKQVLDLLEDVLGLLQLRYERLDGDVSGAQRQAAIRRYEAAGSATPVFLLGTRAGGVGITLTSADTCIIFDPDWNPQNDLQAAARCHRIGQTKQVTVYHLVTRNTYEMSLFERANRKRGLEKALIGKGGFNSTASTGGGAKANNAEISELLRRGARVLLSSEEQAEASRHFNASSIEDLLASHAHVLSRGQDSAEADSHFAQATFVGEECEPLELDDPRFWEKALGAPLSEAAHGGEVGSSTRELRRRHTGIGSAVGGSTTDDDASDEESSPVEMEEEVQKEAEASNSDGIARRWRLGEIQSLRGALLQFGLDRVLEHAAELVGLISALRFRSAEEVEGAARTLVALWLAAQPPQAQPLTEATLRFQPAAPEAEAAPAEAAPAEAAPAEPAPAEPAPAEAPLPTSALDQAMLPASFVASECVEARALKRLQRLRQLRLVRSHAVTCANMAPAEPPPLKVRRKMNAVVGWAAEHDQALLAAMAAHGIPGPQDEKAWAAIRSHGALENLLAAHTASETDEATAPDLEQIEASVSRPGDVLRILHRELSSRLWVLCTALGSAETAARRASAEAAEAREKRRLEAEARRQQRAEAERLKAEERARKAAERAAAEAAKAAARAEREAAAAERRVEKERLEAQSWVERLQEKKEKEAERIKELAASGKDVWLKSRDVADLATERPYPPVPCNAKGKPQERNRSCHLCTQGVASWRGAFTAPIGCSRCPRIFCERCLGNICDESILPLAGGTVRDFFESEWSRWSCLVCEDKCACQSDCAKRVEVSEVEAGSGELLVSTATPHPFREGDSCMLSGIKLAEGNASSQAERELLQRCNKQHSHLRVLSPLRFAVPLELNVPSAPLAKGHGRACLPGIEVHKRWGWVGVMGSGVKGKVCKPVGAPQSAAKGRASVKGRTSLSSSTSKPPSANKRKQPEKGKTKSPVPKRPKGAPTRRAADQEPTAKLGQSRLEQVGFRPAEKKHNILPADTQLAANKSASRALRNGKTIKPDKL